MNRIAAAALVVFIVLVVFGSLICQSALAYNVPSAPQFSLKLVNHVFNAPPTSTTDPFTGKQSTIDGYSRQWTTIDVTITNQEFDGTVVPPDAFSYTGMMYEVDYRGHYEGEWRMLLPNNGLYFVQEPGDKTVLSVLLNGDWSDWSFGSLPERPDSGITVSAGGQVDFQLKAIAGTAYLDIGIPRMWRLTNSSEIGDWSAPQTISIDDGAVTVEVTPTQKPVPSPTATPTQSPKPTDAAPSPHSQQPNAVTQLPFGLGWEHVAVAALAAAVVGLFIVVVVQRGWLKKNVHP